MISAKLIHYELKIRLKMILEFRRDTEFVIIIRMVIDFRIVFQ